MLRWVRWALRLPNALRHCGRAVRPAGQLHGLRGVVELDVVSLDAGVGLGFMGAAFDGRYVYLAPYFTSVVVRFDAKTPPSIPQLPGWTGSFL